MIYADHAATAPLEEGVLEAMEPFLKDSFANPSGSYRFSLTCRRAVEDARASIAEGIGCTPQEIYVTSGGSEANSWAVWNAAQACGKSGKSLLTSSTEHHSLLNACAGAEAFGVKTGILPVDNQGTVRLEELEKRLHTGVEMVSVQYANNETGTIQPVKEIAALCRERKVWFHTDAVQAVGHIPVGIENGIALLSASAHKFGGPKGIGFLYASRNVRLHPLVYGGGQERGVRGGTENVAAIVGMAHAFRKALEKREERAERLRGMEQIFREELLCGVPGATFNGNPDKKLPGLVSVTLPGADAERLIYQLDIAGICVSAGAACDQRGEKQPSHVLRAMGISDRDAMATIRVSFGPANQEEDARTVARELLKLVR